ncbi:MAG: Zn-ribbon domain-containing OB-fold protein [Acidobacteriota bacterium]|nr:Zn-ribbon domain-containing OB-fold protein [Acidobacteriota bacterium]
MSDRKEPLVIRSMPDLRYRHAAGRYGSLFLRGLRDGKILASRCDACDRTLVPPRIACTGCFGEMTEIVEIPPRGTLMSWTVVTFPFIDPFTGVQRPIPYGYGMIRFEGTTNTFQYFLSEKDPSRLRVGAAVEAVFRDERKGEIADLVHFKPSEA